MVRFSVTRKNERGAAPCGEGEGGAIVIAKRAIGTSAGARKTMNSPCPSSRSSFAPRRRRIAVGHRGRGSNRGARAGREQEPRERRVRGLAMHGSHDALSLGALLLREPLHRRPPKRERLGIEHARREERPSLPADPEVLAHFADHDHASPGFVGRQNVEAFPGELPGFSVREPGHAGPQDRGIAPRENGLPRHVGPQARRDPDVHDVLPVADRDRFSAGAPQIGLVRAQVDRDLGVRAPHHDLYDGTHGVNLHVDRLEPPRCGQRDPLPLARRAPHRRCPRDGEERE